MRGNRFHRGKKKKKKKKKKKGKNKKKKQKNFSLMWSRLFFFEFISHLMDPVATVNFRPFLNLFFIQLVEIFLSSFLLLVTKEMFFFFIFFRHNNVTSV